MDLCVGPNVISVPPSPVGSGVASAGSEEMRETRVVAAEIITEWQLSGAE